MTARRVGVLRGGWGEERDISIKTGEAVAQALESKGVAVTRILAGPKLDLSVRSADIDVAFVALHGRMGEDGRVQGLLEVLGIPYTGSGVLASSVAMNKPLAKKLLAHANLATAPGYVASEADLGRLELLHGDLGFPAVVKPACGGSSVGLSFVECLAELGPAVVQACRFGGEALVERYIAGREVTVGLVAGEVLGTCEVAFASTVFDHATKYKGGARYHLPARLSAARLGNVEAVALAAYKALGCRGYARVDLLCSDTDNDVVLEVNTLPGLTPVSLLPKIARAAGVSFEDLVMRILNQAAREGAAVGDEHPRSQGDVERPAVLTASHAQL